MLIREGHTVSNKFKTVGTYNLQPIMLAPVSFRVFCIYVEKIRPIIVPDVNSWDVTDPLFVNYEGRKETNIGSHVQSYFRKKIKTNVTTTVIRSIYETQTHELYKSGKISLRDKLAIGEINGHSGTTVKMFYSKVNADDNVSLAREVSKYWSIEHCALESGRQDNYDLNYFPSPDKDNQRKYTKAPWGTKHSCYKSDKARIAWDDAEVKFLGELANQLLKDDYEKNHRLIIAKCLHIIKADKTALPIFHENHILSTNALKHGWKKYQENFSETQHF